MTIEKAALDEAARRGDPAARFIKRSQEKRAALTAEMDGAPDNVERRMALLRALDELERDLEESVDA